MFCNYVCPPDVTFGPVCVKLRFFQLPEDVRLVPFSTYVKKNQHWFVESVWKHLNIQPCSFKAINVEYNNTVSKL